MGHRGNKQRGRWLREDGDDAGSTLDMPMPSGTTSGEREKMTEMLEREKRHAKTVVNA